MNRVLKHILALIVMSFALSAAPSFASSIFNPEGLKKVGAARAVFGTFNDFNEVARVSLELIEEYPPSEYFYVGVGRSPTPVMAFLNGVIDPEIFINVPLSGLASLAWYREVDSENIHDIYAIRSAHLKAHLKMFLPAADKLAGRRLLLIDFVASGSTLIEAGRQVRDFYDQSGEPNTTIESLALISSRTKYSTREKLEIAQIHSLLIGDGFHWKLRDRAYREFAEYEPFYVMGTDLENYQKPKRLETEFYRLSDLFRQRTYGAPEVLDRLRQIYPSAQVFQKGPRAVVERWSCQARLLVKRWLPE